MPSYATTELSKHYHQAIVDWQRKHFKDYQFLIDNWGQYYQQAPFQLLAKIGDASPMVEVGSRKGKAKYEKAHEIKGNQFFTAHAIIKAQASTEFGSIQQHRETLDRAIDAETQFSILRVMAEELRHGYQMAWVLAHDDWTVGGTDLARETIEELLAMETGSHVLDSFNILFDSFLDNCVYASVIDRVGKYQLTMQRVFAYAPMARSMPPMLQEESFHMACGVNPLKVIAAQAANEKGNFSIRDIQRHFQKWYPRGLEMFGAETGGSTNVQYGFKTLANAEAQRLYIQEVQEKVVDDINFEILKVRKLGQVDRKTAREIADRVLKTREPEPGVSLDDLIHLPSERWLRRRGVHAWTMATPRGEDVRDLDAYERTCAEELPDAYLRSKDFATYREDLRKHVRGEADDATGAGFRMS